MDKEKKEEILREAHERAKAAVTRKEKSILRTVEEPILPALCKIIFIGMLVLTAAMLLVDINAFIRYDSHLGVLHLYRNVVMTGLGSWGMFSVLLILCCFFGMKQAEKRFWKKRKAGGIVDETPEDRERSQRAIRKLLNPFILYMKTSLIGLLLWVICISFFIKIEDLLCIWLKASLQRRPFYYFSLIFKLFIILMSLKEILCFLYDYTA